jgi:hypothetical protein
MMKTKLAYMYIHGALCVMLSGCGVASLNPIAESGEPVDMLVGVWEAREGDAVMEYNVQRKGQRRYSVGVSLGESTCRYDMIAITIDGALYADVSSADTMPGGAESHIVRLHYIFRVVAGQEDGREVVDVYRAMPWTMWERALAKDGGHVVDVGGRPILALSTDELRALIGKHPELFDRDGARLRRIMRQGHGD